MDRGAEQAHPMLRQGNHYREQARDAAPRDRVPASPHVWPRRRLLAGGLLAGVGASAGLLATNTRPATATLGFKVNVPTGVGFTLHVGRTVAGGATVAVYLQRPRREILVVEQFVDTPNVLDLSAPAPTVTGYVPLGQLPAGPSIVPWDFAVNGQTLGPGTYLIYACAAFDNDRPIGFWPVAPTALIIAADGAVSLDTILNAGQPFFIVGLDGGLTPYDPATYPGRT